MVWLILGSLLPSMLLCWVAAWLVRCWGPACGLVDRPGERKVHETEMPTGGGVAIWLGVVLPFAVGQLLLLVVLLTGDAWLPEFVRPYVSGLWQQLPKLWILLAGGTVMMVLGLIDDRRGLGWPVRLGVQVFVATLLVIVMPQLRLSLFLDVPILTGTLSVIWIVGLVNSFNMLDNMDGLSAGVAAIAAGILAAVMLLAPEPGSSRPQLFVGGFLLVLAGSLLGFLWHNRPPARLFMGDAGSYFVGYMLAVATLTATFANESVPHAILAPLCVLAVPIYDTLTVVWIRLRENRSPFVGDRSHFSHRLVELGMSKAQAVWTIYLATATCGLGALLLRQVDIVGACVVLLMVACILILVAILETTGRNRQD